LHRYVVEVDTDCTGEFTFEDFVVFANSLCVLKRSPGRVGTFRHVILQSKHTPMTASMVTNLTPPGSGSDNQNKFKLMTAKYGPCN
jgi:hypothetical protein